LFIFIKRALFIHLIFKHTPEDHRLSTMYKKLHKEETRPYAESFSLKGSLFMCLPERDIMLTLA